MMVRRSGRAPFMARWATATMSSSPGWVLAASHTRASRKRGGEALVPRQIDRRRRRVGLEIADAERAGRAERGEALGEALVLREHEIEGREQRPAQARAPAPAAEGADRHAAVDQHQRNVARVGLQHEVRPDLRFDEHREVRAPML